MNDLEFEKLYGPIAHALAIAGVPTTSSNHLLEIKQAVRRACESVESGGIRELEAEVERLNTVLCRIASCLETRGGHNVPNTDEVYRLAMQEVVRVEGKP